MTFQIEEDNKRMLEEILKNKLPEENEVIILPGGLIVLDEESTIRIEELKNGESILCGC